jgi:hypothetical protein
MRMATVGALQLLLFLVACDGVIENPGGTTLSDVDASFDPEPGRVVTAEFPESDADVANPERGYYVGFDLRRHRDLSWIRAGGHTVAISVVKLPDYKDRPLDDALLTALQDGLAAARAAGVKVILRFAYNSGYTGDAPGALIVRHIEQLTPVLHDNVDVISVMQAGFIGAWGEWHSSTNGLDNPRDRAAILDALLTALPPSRGVQVRRPTFKEAYLPGGPVDEPAAFNGSPRARLGHHNDCFLASNSDYGTYDAPVEEWKAYVAADGRYTAVGGETCSVNSPRSDCANAVAEMEALHWSYLNSQYNRDVLASWDAQGCGSEVRRRLGYRLSVEQVAHTEAVAPGGELTVAIRIRNTGFAAVYNHRPVEVVLTDGATRLVARLADVDARRWAAGTTTTVAARLRIPGDLAAGRYSLALRLPDDAAGLADDPRYAIQLANDDLWDAPTGDNVLTRTVAIDPSAPGPRDPNASRFVELR